MTTEITMAQCAIGKALRPAFLALRAKGVLDLDFDRKKVHLKLLASDAFRLILQPSTDMVEALIVVFALFDVLKKRALYAEVFAIDAAFCQSVQKDGRIASIPWPLPEFEKVEFDANLEKRVMRRLTSLESEGVI
jgi:hypothetical protein